MDPRAPVFVPQVLQNVRPVSMMPRMLPGNNIVWMTPAAVPIQTGISSQSHRLPLLYPARCPTVLQDGMVSSGPLPLMFTPVTSKSMSASDDSAKETLEWQMLKPEAFPCGLPTLDLPTPVLHPTPRPVVKQVKQTKPKSSHPKPKSKPKVPKTPKLVKKAVPESKPLFEPVPLGAKHAKTKIQFFGDKVALSKRPGIYKTLHKSRPGKSGKCVTSRKGCKALVSELPLFSEKDMHASSAMSANGKACKKIAARFESDSNVSSKSMEGGAVSESNVSDTCGIGRNVTECCAGEDKEDTAVAVDNSDEYSIEYLYLTKFILRKKTKPSPVAQKRKHSDEEQPSAKRTRGETHAAKILPEVFHFENTESLLTSDILDLF